MVTIIPLIPPSTATRRKRERVMGGSGEKRKEKRTSFPPLTFFP